MEIITITTGIAIIITGFITGEVGLTVLVLLKIVVATLSGFLILTGFACFLVSLSIMLYGRRSLFEVFYEVLELGQYPITIYPKTLRVIFTFFMPIGFLATYPYLALHETRIFVFLIMVSLVSIIGGYGSFRYFLKAYKSGA